MNIAANIADIRARVGDGSGDPQSERAGERPAAVEGASASSQGAGQGGARAPGPGGARAPLHVVERASVRGDERTTVPGGDHASVRGADHAAGGGSDSAPAQGETRPGRPEPAKLGSRRNRLLVEPLAFEEQGVSSTVRLLLLLAAVLVVAAIVWASVTPVDELASAPGQVLPGGQIKLIQHLEGGVVAEILVVEGELVRAGQALVRLSPAVARGELEQMLVRADELRLRIERLNAVIEGREPEFGERAQTRPALVADQMRIWRNQRESVLAALAVIESQVAQRREELKQLGSALAIARRHLEITNKELEIRRQGAARRLVALQILLETERSQVAAEGEVNRLEHQIRLSTDALSEVERRLHNQETTLRQDALVEMGAAAGELAQVLETAGKLQDRVVRLDVRSPVDGLVQDLQVHAPGEVVTPGGSLMRVVPVGDRLMAEVRIATSDVGHVRAGQPVRLKVSSYEYTRYGFLAGTLAQVSPTTLIDEQGQPYYKGVIAMAQTYIGRDPDRNPILPGMVVQADIVTGSKTLAAYLLKPVAVAMGEAFHER